MDVMTTSALTPTMSAMVASTQFLGAPLQMMMVAPSEEHHESASQVGDDDERQGHEQRPA